MPRGRSNPQVVRNSAFPGSSKDNIPALCCYPAQLMSRSLGVGLERALTTIHASPSNSLQRTPIRRRVCASPRFRRNVSSDVAHKKNSAMRLTFWRGRTWLISKDSANRRTGLLPTRMSDEHLVKGFLRRLKIPYSFSG